MVGSRFCQKLVGDLAVDVLLHDFLQGRLVVFHILTAVDGKKLIVQLFEDVVVCRLPAAVEVDRADDRLEGVGEHRRAMSAAHRRFAVTEQQVFAKLQFRRATRERRLTHDGSARLRQLAFRPLGKALEEIGARRQLQNRISQEL